MELSGSNVVSVCKENVYCSVDDEIIILSVEDEVYYKLDSVAAFIWDIIDEPKTVDEILEAILNEYDVEKDESESDLIELLYGLLKKGLIEIKEG